MEKKIKKVSQLYITNKTPHLELFIFFSFLFFYFFTFKSIYEVRWCIIVLDTIIPIIYDHILSLKAGQEFYSKYAGAQ